MKCDADASLEGQDVLFLSQSTEAHLSVCRSMTEGIAELIREQLSQRDIALQSAEYKAGIFGKQCYQSGQRLKSKERPGAGSCQNKDVKSGERSTWAKN